MHPIVSSASSALTIDHWSVSSFPFQISLASAIPLIVISSTHPSLSSMLQRIDSFIYRTFLSILLVTYPIYETYNIIRIGTLFSFFFFFPFVIKICNNMLFHDELFPWWPLLYDTCVFCSPPICLPLQLSWLFVGTLIVVIILSLSVLQ